MDVMLQVDGLHFSYDGAPPLFDDWSTAIEPGIALLYGESGTGKTTLLRLLSGHLPAARGRIAVAGQRLDDAGVDWRRQVCWIDPGSTDFDDQTVDGFIERWRADWAAFDDADWLRHVDGFGLTPHRAKRFDQLSTGSRRKVWIGASLASGAPLTLLDEPTAALDRPSINYLWHALAAREPAARQLVLVASFARPAGLTFDAVVALPDQAAG